MELEVNVICITADKKQFARCFSSSIIDKSVKEITVMTSSILFYTHLIFVKVTRKLEPILALGFPHIP